MDQNYLNYISQLGMVFVPIYLLALALYIFRLNRNRLNNRAYALVTLAAFLWMDAALFMPLIGIKWTLVFGGLSSMAIFYFSLIFPENKDIFWKTKSVIMAIALGMSLTLLATDIPMAVYYAYAAVLIFATIAVASNKLFRTSDKEKMQAIFLVIITVFGAGMAQFFVLLSPSLGPRYFEMIGPLLVIISFSIGAYGIAKYGLFFITPQIAATEILDSMKQPLIICDVSGNILYQNAFAQTVDQNTLKLIIDRVLSKGFMREKITLLEETVYVNAIFSEEEGAIAILLENVTELEKAADQERSIFTRVDQKLKSEKELEKILTNIGLATSTEEAKIKKLPPGLDEEGKDVVEKFSQMAQKKFILLQEAQEDKVKLEETIKKGEKIQQENIARELKMVELKEKIIELKGETP